MATTAPSVLWGMYALIDEHFQSEKKGGIVGDSKHGSGYHVSPEDLKRWGKTSDYSIQCPADKRGEDDQAAAIDITFGSTAEMWRAHGRLMAACRVNDPRVGPVREIIGTTDGIRVSGFNRVATGSGSRSKVGEVKSGFGDDTHLWHEHISFLRDTVNDRNAIAGVAEVICGLKPGTLGWSADGSKEPVKPTYLPAYIVDPLKVSTTLLANAPAGHDDIERKPGFRIYTGVKIEGKWLVTEAGYRYHTDFLVLESEFKARPATPKPEAPKPPVPVVKPEPAKPAPEKSDGPTFLKVAYVNPPGEGNHQGAIPTEKYWYLAEARKQKDGSEDTYVYRFPRGAEGAQVLTELDPFVLNASPGNKVHPTGWGVSESGVLWFTWNGEGLGNDVVTANFAAGKSVTKEQCQEMHMFTEGNAQIAFDRDNDMASVRIITGSGTKGTDTHLLRSKQDILDNKDRVLGTVKIPRKATRIVQGFTLVKVGEVWELRVLTGLKSAKSPFTIERWNAETGKHIADVALPDLGREPEGIDGDIVGFKVQNRSGLDMFRYTV